ncbi:unnamed protein product [Closterium sp. NIES-54]
MTVVQGTGCGGKRLLAPEDDPGIVTLGRDGTVLDGSATVDDKDDRAERVQEFLKMMDLMKVQGMLPPELLCKNQKGNMAEISNNPTAAITEPPQIPQPTHGDGKVKPSPLNLSGPLEDAAEGATEAVEQLNALGLPVVVRTL